LKDNDPANDHAEREGSSTISDGQQNRREPIPAPKPSQAEGDRETIEQDLQDKDHGSEIKDRR
jgi:hypothetical protein